MKRVVTRSMGGQAGAGVVLIVVDVVVIAWLLYGYGLTGWADAFAERSAPQAPQIARQAMWILAGGAVVTGGCLLVLRRRLAGIVQLLVLGGGAGVFAFLAAK